MTNEQLVNFGIFIASVEVLFIIFMIVLIVDQRKKEND